jgi:plasmid stability protein
MTSITLKNLPEDLLQALREAAERDRRSLTQEIIYLLDSAVSNMSEPSDGRRVVIDAQVAAWRKLAGKWESDVDAATESARILKERTTCWERIRSIDG